MMKTNKLLSISLLLWLLLLGGQAAAQCYQPTMNAARKAENSGNYERATSLYKEAQGCYDCSSQQKSVAKAAETRCRKALEQQQQEAADQRAAERKRKEEQAAAERKRKEEAAAAERKRKEEQAAAERKRKKENLTLTVGGVSFKMVWVEGGTFTMGCTPEQGGDCWDSELPAHSVTLDGYYIGETEVTQALWTAVMGTTVRQQRDKADSSYSLPGEGNNYPMYYVNYDEAVQFARKLSQLTGRTFSLPTEAEWEYAARGGSKSLGYKYAGSNGIDAVAWYNGNSGDQTHPVAQKAANELGLYDMSGNMWEWCSDWYGGYSSGTQRNPTGPGSGSDRVLRGGSWFNYGSRVSYRYRNNPTSRYSNYGFRLVFRP